MHRSPVMRVEGPLARYAPGFRLWLLERGYRPSTIEDHVWLMGHLSRWLTERDLAPDEFGDGEAERFQRHRRERYSHLTGSRGLVSLLGYLREMAVIPRPSVPATPVEVLVAEYRDHLLHERGMVAGSVVLRERVARLFLDGLPAPIDATLRQLGPRDVTRFVVDQCGDGRRRVAWAKTLTSGLRSLLVFLHLTGRVPVPLVEAVPSVAGWRLSSLPRALEAEHVTAVLASCDRTKPVGRRDFAILILLARLGLRACEVAAMSLEDIDWRTGELTVHGKGGQIDRLPLPHDVGDALAQHLLVQTADRDDRREVFLRAFAPRGPMSAVSIGCVLRDACDRAGVQTVGTHRLRHTVATDLLRAGAPLAEIAPILRHTSMSSTAIYAKVDRKALRALARPWPLPGAPG